MFDTRKIIETSSNLAILVVCGLIGYTLITHKSLNFGRSPEGTQEAQLVGQTLPALPGHSWSGHSKTLVVALRKGCSHCDASLPFYKQLSDLQNSNQLHAHLLAVMPDPAVVGEQELASNGVHVENVFNQSLETMKVPGTPTLLLLNANGRIDKAWVGELPPARQKEVINALEK